MKIAMEKFLNLWENVVIENKLYREVSANIICEDA